MNMLICLSNPLMFSVDIGGCATVDALEDAMETKTRCFDYTQPIDVKSKATT